MVDKEEYNRYINSPTWKQKRAAALNRAQYRCEICGFSKWSRTLEVHHKTYERFQRELPGDLIVVCKECHVEQDKIRAEQSKMRSYRALNNARLAGWAAKKYGDDWENYYDAYDLLEEYEQWLERKWGF
jgi:5-methylcytosine-specific restriction endonuclease McrA